jgi:hypothetical protein
MIDKFIWSELKFGKYRSRNLPEIATSDPDWYYQRFRRNLFPPPLDEQADLIGYQLGNIKPPRPDSDNWRFEYICSNNSDNKLLDVELLRADDVVRPTPVNRQILGVFSFLWPRLWIGYDKSCSELLVAGFQQYYFGESGISKARCEGFFSNPDNFDWTWFRSWKAHPELYLMFR